jgi:hypothetical protein
MTAGLETIDVLIARIHELQDTLQSEASETDLQYSIDRVVSAGSRDATFEIVNRFEPDTKVSQADASSEEALASITLELHAGNVLVAAGQAVSSVDAQAGAEANSRPYLDEALAELEHARNTVKQSSSPEARANFEANLALAAVQITAEQAPGEFRKRTEGTLDGLVADSESVVNKIFEKLKKTDGSKVVQALAKFADETDVFKNAARLIRQGIEKIQNAYNALIRLIGNELLKGVKDKVQKIWSDFADGKFTRDGLESMYAVQYVRKKAEGLLQNPRLDRQRLIEACADLAPLEPKFKKHMDLLNGFVAGIAIAAVVLPFTPLQPNAVLIVAGAYLLVLGAIILIGREYAGSEWTLHWVRGVGQIVLELETPKAR